MVADDWHNNNNDRRRPARTVQVAVVASLFLLPCASFAQQNSKPQPRSIQASSRSTRRPSQSFETWYESLLKRFNPGNLDYGRWMEQRRRVFLDASVRNPYFHYSACITILLLIMILLYGKKWTDHRRALLITAEMMTDLYKHDAHSRQIAREAIQKYNDHIERCNRLIESGEYGLALPAQDAECHPGTKERDSYKDERELGKDDLAEKEGIAADMPLRLDALATKSDEFLNAGAVVDSQSPD
jgi:hypothetical protein